MTEREKIIQVLTHAVELGSKSKYYGIRFYMVHDSTVVEFERGLKKELKAKKELFKKVPDKSYTYKIILNFAKSSLEKLKKGDFDKTSSELINIFLSLQSVFSNDLEFVECKEYEKIIEEVINTESEEDKQKRLKILKRKIRDVKYLEEGVTAKIKRKKKEKDIEKQEMFSNANELDL